jgi:hypothetical protein
MRWALAADQIAVRGAAETNRQVGAPAPGHSGREQAKTQHFQAAG